MQKKIIYMCTVAFAILIYLFTQTREFVSVIIPVYNAEKYISKCLDSVVSQQGIEEIIIVNDGSTDNSSKIIENYAKKYSKIKVINQENKGVSEARNIGIKQAKAKYITFIDSDDWLEPESFKKVINIIKKDNSDIVLTGFYDVYDSEWVRGVRGEDAAKDILEERKFRNKNLDNIVLFTPFNSKDAYSDLFYIGGGVRARFFNNEFIKKNKISFPKNIHCYEDDVFLYKAFLHNPKISVLNEPIYNYHNRLDSISKSKNILQCGPESLEIIKESPEYKQATRREQILISDSFVASVFLSIANYRRNKLPLDDVMVMAKNIYDSFSQYNKQELKYCRNYNTLKKILYPDTTNQGF